ncbi:MAG: phenylacetate-CoA oxygenase subunit PaaJ [Bacteroidia bacterium]|nr:phenylacetate-CoA oxygenase subunit PaaJ [Bacteroidia bacterium]
MSTTLTDWTEDEILEILNEVKDPEIPVISVVDLGIVREISIRPEGVDVLMTPTFAGCPAIDVMKKGVIQALANHGISPATVTVDYKIPWSSNMVSPRGKQLLKDFGLSPPPAFDGMLTLEVLQNALCPKCGSNNTWMMNAFGPTACRAVHHCRNCQETFEQFKPL